ncbi:hypothetical protein DP113_12880 [Brasilonema octagenarum UFV-E1]|uniref:Uncharacterized protein n=1 Tax=Brasilonema sennae CENA114 TaxID=415709 RepID=A0A856MD96_9CYAN|nr:hypothetical protein [Brasilonema sennae]QDL08678.1 hypothetical protein DP114_12945 [Brasilonema sennae CENA114]QDL15033.1 hypothetical protein DP113_12880 [Brasilonema octagenarum UFV-E1]
MNQEDICVEPELTRIYRSTLFLGQPVLQYCVVAKMGEHYRVISDWKYEDQDDKQTPLRPLDLLKPQHLGRYLIYLSRLDAMADILPEHRQELVKGKWFTFEDS